MAITLTAGQTAPAFEGIDQNNQEIRLADFLGRKVVLYFYPKDDTPGCTKQACNLRDNYQTLLDASYAVIGISADDVASHQQFIAKYQLPFPLIADTDKSIATTYGAWGEKNIYGKIVVGMLRTTFVIDEKGVIESVIKKVKTDDHTAQILAKK
jgi:thioredoxin-dependent peroxiredoxin